MDLSTHGIVALVRDGNGRFLMLEDARDPMRGLWAPPHGRCEITDGSEEASVIREVREETGLLVRPVNKVLTQPADSKVSTVSFWIVDSESNTPILNEESSSFGWFNVEEILDFFPNPSPRKLYAWIKQTALHYSHVNMMQLGPSKTPNLNVSLVCSEQPLNRWLGY